MNDNSFCFVDSNVWLYDLVEPQKEEDKKKVPVAKQLLKDCKSKMYVSSQVVNEVIKNMIYSKDNFSDEDIKGTIEYFYHSSAVVSVVDMSEDLIMKAWKVRSVHPNTFNYWDSLIVAAALFSGVGILYSEDMHDGFEIEVDNQKLKIINPFPSSG